MSDGAAPPSRSRADHGELLLTVQNSGGLPPHLGKTFLETHNGDVVERVNLSNSTSFIEYRGVPSIERLASIFEWIHSKPYMALVCGEAISDEWAHFPNSDGELTVIVPIAKGKKSPRSLDNFADTPTRVFSIDFDKVPIAAIDNDFRPIADINRLPDFYLALIEAIGADWLKSNCIIRPSGSYGRRDDVVSFHVTYALDQPLTLAAKSTLADAIQAAAVDKGITASDRSMVDWRIYSAEHLLFTARPLFYGVDGELTRDPLAGLKRLYIGHYGDDVLRAPAELLEAAPSDVASKSRPQRRNGKPQKASGRRAQPSGAGPTHRRHERAAHLNKLLKAIGPGNTDVQVRDYSWSVALYDWHRPYTVPRHKARIADAIRASYPADTVADKVSEHLKSFDEKLYRAAHKLGRIFPTSDPPRPLPTMTLENARADADTRMQEAIVAVERWAADPSAATPSPVHVLAHIQGVGKSTAAARHLTLDRLRALRIAYVAPTVELAEQRASEHRVLIVSELTASGLPEAEAVTEAHALVRVHVGFRKACGEDQRGELAETVGRAGGSLIRLCEGDRRSGAAACPFLASCSWPAQRRDTTKGIVYQAHANLITSMRAMENEPDRAYDFTIIDESPMGVLLGGARTIKLEDLEKFLARDVFNMHGESVDQQAYLSELIGLAKFNAGLSVFAPRVPFAPQGFKHLDEPETFRPPPIIAEDGTSTPQLPVTKLRCEWAAETFRKEIERQRRALMEGAFGCIGSEHGADKALKRAAARISTLETIARAFECVAMSARLGRPNVIGLQVYGDTLKCHIANQLPETVLARPTIWLDASYRPEVLAEIYRDRPHTLTVSGQDSVAAPHAHVLQVVDSFARSSLKDGTDRPECGPDGIEITAGKRDNGARKLARIIAFHALQHARGCDCGVREAVRDDYGNAIGERRVDVAVICQKSVESDLAKILAEYGITNVAIRHYNAIRGLNDFARIPCLIVVGRPAPAIRDLEDMASAFFWRHPGLQAIHRTGDIETSNGDRPAWMPRASRAVLMTDGSGRAIEGERHPDPFAEIIRSSISDDEVVQAIFRGRPLSRTADAPLNIVYLGSSDPGLPVSQLLPRDVYQIDAGDIMIAEGVGVGAPDLIARGWGSYLQAGGRRLLEGMAPEYRERFQALSMSSCSGGRESAPDLNIDREPPLRPGADSTTPMQLTLRAAEVTLADRWTGSILAPATTFFLAAELTEAAVRDKIEARLSCWVRLFRWLDPMPLRPPAPQPYRDAEPAAIAAGGGEAALLPTPALAAVPSPILPPLPPAPAKGDREMIVVQEDRTAPRPRCKEAASGQPQNAIGEAAPADDGLSPTLRAVFERMRHTPGRPNPWRLLAEQMAIEEKAAREARKTAKKAAVAGGGAGAT